MVVGGAGVERGIGGGGILRLPMFKLAARDVISFWLVLGSLVRMAEASPFEM